VRLDAVVPVSHRSSFGTESFGTELYQLLVRLLLLMTVRAAGAPQSSGGDADRRNPTSPANLADAPIATSRTLVLEDGRGQMFINGQTFTGNAPLFSNPAVEGTVEEWTRRASSNSDSGPSARSARSSDPGERTLSPARFGD
jgi:hypothetical protein